MNEQQIILILVMEECAEVAQRASKALRFGLHEVQEGQPFDNLQRLTQEIVDLQAVITLLPSPQSQDIANLFERKFSKVQKYLAYSRELGIVP